MASSVIGSLGPTWMMVKEPAMCARLFKFNVRFRSLVLSSAALVNIWFTLLSSPLKGVVLLPFLTFC
jgi:hypothetical protein